MLNFWKIIVKYKSLQYPDGQEAPQYLLAEFK